MHCIRMPSIYKKSQESLKHEIFHGLCIFFFKLMSVVCLNKTRIIIHRPPTPFQQKIPGEDQ